MGTKITTFVAVAIIYVTTLSPAWSQVITEEEVSVNVLTWFHHRYDEPTDLTWEKIKSESGEDLIKVKGKYNDHKLTAVYSLSGKVLYENIDIRKNDMPEHLLDYAETNFTKYKMMSIQKHTNFAYGARDKKEINYEMNLKVGKELITFWFDERMNRYNNFDVSKLAVQ